jgi:transglutaminase-like putative cysteine protease
MRIHVGCELSFEFPQTTPMITTLNVHFSRVSELERPDYLITNPSVPIEGYRDSFGNWCNRLVAPSDHFSLGTDAIIRDSGMADPIDLNAQQHQVQHLPAEVILFLLGSRYCETDRLSDEAWRLLGNTPLGWPRVQAICGFAHNHLIFGYEQSRVTRTVFEAHQERFAVAFCRCLNIPARYCTGYITDIGLPPPYALMDFSAWIEVYLGHRWYAFDPRNNAPPDRPYSHCAGPRRRRRASNQYVWSRKFVRVFASGQMKCRQDDTPPSRAFFAKALVRGSATRSRIAGLLRADRHIRRSLRRRRSYTGRSNNDS